MTRLHAKYPDDSEAAIFYALSMLEAVDLTDKTYAQQLKAAAHARGVAESAARIIQALRTT